MQYKLATGIRVCAVPIHFSGRGMQGECYTADTLNLSAIDLGADHGRGQK
jgi:hypothetical protein